MLDSYRHLHLPRLMSAIPPQSQERCDLPTAIPDISKSKRGRSCLKRGREYTVFSRGDPRTHLESESIESFSKSTVVCGRLPHSSHLSYSSHLPVNPLGLFRSLFNGSLTLTPKTKIGPAGCQYMQLNGLRSSTSCNKYRPRVHQDTIDGDDGENGDYCIHRTESSHRPIEATD